MIKIMIAIIVILSMILFVLIYTYFMLKIALEFMAQKLVDIDRILEKLSKNK